MRSPLNRFAQEGFTPLEVLIAASIGLVAIMAFTSFNTVQMYTMRNQSNQVDLQTSARSIADLFGRDVRRAGTGTNTSCDPSKGSTGLIQATSTLVRIKADLSLPFNGNTTDANEDVTYRLDSTNNAITRTDTNTAATAVTLWSGTSISGSQLTYFDGAGNQLTPSGSGLTGTQLQQVVRINLALALTGNVVQPGDTMQLTATDGASVELRNRFFAMNSQCTAVCGATPGVAATPPPAPTPPCFLN
jgi:type II secretory pathway component PulJ